jgi:iron complex transport system substrate-binding protein
MRKQSYIFIGTLAVLILILIASIEAIRRYTSYETQSSVNSPSMGMGVDNPYPRKIEDADGNKITIPVRPQRIASHTLLTDEVLFAITSPERIVSITNITLNPLYSNVIKEAKDSRAQVAMDAEQILSLKPDIIFIASYTRAEIVELLRAAKAPVVKFANFERIEDIKKNIRMIGYIIGEDKNAEALSLQMDKEIESIRARIPKSSKPPRILSYNLSGNTAGRETSFDNMTKIVGAINVAAEQNLKGFPQVSGEQVLKWQPDFIVIGAESNRVEEVRHNLLSNPAIAASHAGRNGRIIIIENRYLLSVSHHIVKAIDALAKGLYGN